MRSDTKFALLLIVCLLVRAVPVFPQSPAKPEKSLGRIVGTISGAVGGAFLGYLVSDDDARNATQKLTRNVVLLSIAGGAGGYFLGRAVDKQFALSDRDINPLGSAELRRDLIRAEASRFREIVPAQ